MKQNTQGFVMVCVLWVLAILTVVTVGFGRRAVLDRRAAAYALDHAQAMMMARGAVQRGIVELRNKALKDRLKAEEERGMVHLGQEWAHPKNLLKESRYFAGGDEFADDTVNYIIVDLEARICPNACEKKFLEAIEGMSRSVKRQIWTRRTKGVHEGEFRAPIHAIEEIRYMRGVDDDDWFGTRGNPGLAELLSPVGTGRINLNTASEEVLASVPKLGDNAVKKIIAYRIGDDGQLGTRDDRGFQNLDKLEKETGVRGDSLEALKQFCKTSSDFFKITGYATRRGGAVRAVCSAVARIGGNSAQVISWQEEPLGS